MPRLVRSGAGAAGGIARNGSSSYAHWIDDLTHLRLEEVLHEQAGVALNGETAAFLSAVGTHLVTASLLLCVFSALRRRYPRVYAGNALSGLAPGAPPASFLGWAGASLEVSVEQAIDSVGLDAAMMLEFMTMSLKIMLIIGVPMVFILGPLNLYFGDGSAGNNHIDYLSIKNVRPGGWLDWLHALVLWAVVFAVRIPMYEARSRFLIYRYRWLGNLPEIRANTVMVYGVPPELQSDGKLAKFFDKVLPGKDVVKSAYVTRKTTELLNLWTRLNEAKSQLSEAEATWEKTKEAGGEERPTLGLTCCGLRGKVDSIEHFSEHIKELTPKVQAERARVDALAAEGDAEIHASTGFVTFNSHLHREIALRLQKLYRKRGQVVTSDAPEPKDVLWSGLTKDDKVRQLMIAVGLLLMGCLLVAYTPLVILITSVATHTDMGLLQPLWAGVAPTLGLTIMIGFLPTLLNLIITSFFPLKTATGAQHELQFWYFWFQVLLVLLASAIQHDIVGFFRTVVEAPLHIFTVMARTMPEATGFYMSFLVLEWSGDAQQLLRAAELLKFVLWRQIHNEEKAKELSEPEDQDYNGIGARSARLTIFVAISVVFGTLCPPIWLICALSLAFKRLVFGYLLVYAETRKPDLGGVFWVDQLRGIFVACAIHAALMVAVLFRRCGLSGPTLLAAPAIAYVFWAMQRFDAGFSWQSLPISDVADIEESRSSGQRLRRINSINSEFTPTFTEIKGTFIQPELLAE